MATIDNLQAATQSAAAPGTTAVFGGTSPAKPAVPGMSRPGSAHAALQGAANLANQQAVDEYRQGWGLPDDTAMPVDKPAAVEMGASLKPSDVPIDEYADAWAGEAPAAEAAASNLAPAPADDAAQSYVDAWGSGDKASDLALLNAADGAAAAMPAPEVAAPAPAPAAAAPAAAPAPAAPPARLTGDDMMNGDKATQDRWFAENT